MFRKFANLKLFHKLLISLVLVILLLGVLLFIGANIFIKETKKEIFNQQMVYLKKYFDLKLHTKKQVGITNAITLSQDSIIKKALITNNRSLVIEELKNISKLLKKYTDFKNVKIHVHTNDIHSFVRLWKLDKFGDDLSTFRKSLTLVKRLKKPLVGIEIGRAGLVLRGIAPILDKNRYLGSVEFIQGLNSISLSSLKDGIYVITLMDKKYSSIATFLKNIPTLFEHYGIVTKTYAYDKEFVEELYKSKIKKLKPFFTTKNFYVVTKKIKDIEGNVVGYALIAKRIKDINANIEQSTKKIYMFIIFIIVSVTIALLVILSFILNKFVNKPLFEIKKSLMTFFEFLKNPSVKIIKINIKSHDEFGEIAKNINENISIIAQMHRNLKQLMDAMDKYVISYETDKDDKIISYVSKAYCQVSGYSKEELIGKSHEILFYDKSVLGEIENRVKNYESWEGEVRHKKKNGSLFWVKMIISPKCTRVEGACGYTAIMFDITDKKELEHLKEVLELKVEEKTKELAREKRLITSILNSQDSIVFVTDGREVITANEAFFKFFGVKDIDEFKEKYGKCVCNTFDDNVNISEGYLTKYINGNYWLDYVIKNKGKEFKVVIKKDKNYIFKVAVDKFEFENKTFVTVVLTDITDLELAKKEIEELHKNTKESIEFASLIQKSLLPSEKDLEKSFKDYFVIWEPKDIVGGDIWLFDNIRDDESLLMVFDCTGHGVPGAFVTMLIKAIEREVISQLKRSVDCEISPSKILAYFNKSMKKFLELKNNKLLNVGFDAGIIYYNRKGQILKFSGANIPLFYVDEKGRVEIIKGSKYSGGYKKCDSNYSYNEVTLNVNEGMRFYLSTDGFLDQIGGDKGFPFGKKRFKKLIEELNNLSLKEQKRLFLEKLNEYQGDNERVDDITVIGVEIPNKSYKKMVVIFEYEGIITQNVIASAIDNIEAKIDNINIVSKLSTVTIEIAQNITKYAKDNEAFIKILAIENKDKIEYKIISKNVVLLKDKEKIEQRLLEIKSLNKTEIRKKYKELRKNEKNMHSKGAGIGFYEIARVVDEFDYKFEENKEKIIFTFIDNIKLKKGVIDDKC
jgi:PAS domain S-box-containing protein